MKLENLGWSAQGADQDRNELVRITAVHKSHYIGVGETVELNLHLSGRLQHVAVSAAEYPAVGDWVRVSPQFVDEQNRPAALVEEVLPSKSGISRIGSGGAGEQVIAANVDYALILTSVNKDFSINRLQRYILLANEGGVEPVVVLSKVDLDPAFESVAEKLQEQLKTVPVIATSSTSGVGIESLAPYTGVGNTSVFLGSSGVGKSSLVNRLLGEEVQATKTVREDDDKGRHTTTSRELFFIAAGGMIIDTPGLREVHVVGSEDSVQATFSSIGALIGSCKFSDCEHISEPGCAVLAAVESGEVSKREYESFLKLQKEAEHSKMKLDKRLASNQKKRWKQISKDIRRIKK